MPGATAGLEVLQSELGQQMEPPAAGEGGSPSVGPAGVLPWVRKAQFSSQYTLGSTGPGLLLQELREAAPGIGSDLEVRLGDPGAVVPWA